jgi:hypothetical protein
MANENLDKHHEELIAIIESAFPKGDLEGHKIYHEKMMKQEEDLRLRAIEKAEEEKKAAAEKAEERKEIVLEVKKKVIAGSVWAAVLVALSIVADKIFGVHLS